MRVDNRPLTVIHSQVDFHIKLGSPDEATVNIMDDDHESIQIVTWLSFMCAEFH